MTSHERPLTRARRAEAHDMQSLLFTFLDELLFVFSTEFLVVRTLELHAIDRSNWTMRVVGYAPELS
jgi:SHS2 domain-containing protein